MKSFEIRYFNGDSNFPANLLSHNALREKCPYSELSWSGFFRIPSKYGEILQSECGKMRTRITPNTDTLYTVIAFVKFH